MFNFVSHQNVLDQSFPCNTLGGPASGKPCTFPFIYQSVEYQQEGVTSNRSDPTYIREGFKKKIKIENKKILLKWLKEDIETNFSKFLTAIFGL